MQKRIGDFTASVIERLRLARGNLEQIRIAIKDYVLLGYQLGLTSGELVDMFCVSTPNVLESAGYTDRDADIAVELFDLIHYEVIRGNVR